MDKESIKKHILKEWQEENIAKFYKIHKKEKWQDKKVKEELNRMKKKQLKFYKYVIDNNPVEELTGYKTMLDNDKLVYQRKVPIDKKSPDKFSNITAKSIANIKLCGCRIRLIADVNLEHKKVVEIIRCKKRFCPLCSKIKSLQDGIAISSIMDYLKQQNKYKFLFLTITAPNITSEQLKNEINDYYIALRRFFKTKKIKDIVLGALGKLEVTYNSKSTSKSYGTYHPHFHYILVVPKDYNKDSLNYLERDELLKLWQRSKRDETITQLDIREINGNDKGGAVREIAKYLAKDSQYLKSKEILQTFYNALHGTRMYRPSGIFREMFKKFKNGELEKYIKDDEIIYVYELLYTYQNEQQGYKEKHFKLLTNEERIAYIQQAKQKIIKEFDE